MKQTARYFSRKYAFIWDQQGTVIQWLQPWQATCKFFTAREGEHFNREDKEVGRAIVNGVHGFSPAESLPVSTFKNLHNMRFAS